MCGRYVVAYDPQTLVSGFSLTRIQPFDKRWNIAPTASVPVVYETRAGERVAEMMRWGLVPHWAKDTSIGAKLNNARSEGMADKPSFGQAVRRRRCILPASGFYEWNTPLALAAAGQVAPGDGALPAAPDPQRLLMGDLGDTVASQLSMRKAAGKPAKQPWYISPTTGPFFAMAGLFEAWRPKPAAGGEPGRETGTGVDGQASGAADEAPWLLTCCVITTAPNALMAPIHDRMPVMLAPEHWAAWLSRDLQDPAALAPLMNGLPEGAMQAWPVDRAVGRSSDEGEQLMRRIEPPR